ncbi:response regulator [Schleiferilactobacillus harbinensis]|uniref:Alkaline phosphatase synthesis two-component response regulator n=1 Tax=Schleiferilactobacillus harbinensis DSM 16991 TaxID=1122147 RepID=A0A0R1XN79_9LACO|nr:response regulator transcription factor [Schleiferilactobacillus harbinensis]KRM29307.1 Alkaline phosphatase synthesis two-component response regulator [Schleiferilactobacillus harbinensis DSM 16991]MBO3091366.1 response regulator transcription factor [Schleiferilactobacillus harbinensis]QEU46079.1 response regulator transcription factor [Schleiferilactobacillus harbinensis]QFR64395.1 response regulator [Schleiferilactobacillus harbinensis]GEK05139.1 DNA-binding response regulator [Schleife
MTTRILVVDDESTIRTLIEYNLSQEGFTVDTAEDGDEALQKAEGQDYDLILLDLMLPGKDGLAVTKTLRQEKNATPIIMLTAKDSETDKIVGLELGADDYVTKPFSVKELLARIHAVLRRMEAPTEALATGRVVTFGPLTVDIDGLQASLRGAPLTLTPKEFDVLAYLVQRPNRVISREHILDAVWGVDYPTETRTVDMQISHLREKIEANPKEPQYLQTIRGFGYKLTQPTSEVSE